MHKNSKIYVSGHTGLVGSAIVRRLKQDGYNNIICKKHSELDLTNQKEVQNFFETERPEYVFHAAAKVGGINANKTYPVEFIYDNMMMEFNVLMGTYRCGVRKLLHFGSSCIYPKDCPQPIKEDYMLSGQLEHTSEGYALAKISGIKLCEYFNKQYGTSFISIMPASLYGPNDCFDLQNSHVLPALVRKMHEAKLEGKKSLELWGTGKPLREFLYVDDLADACMFLMEHYNGRDYINVGTGKDISIYELANTVKKVVDYKGEIVFDTSRPDGTYRKLLDISGITNLGWSYKTEFEDGLKQTYLWFLDNVNNLR